MSDEELLYECEAEELALSRDPGLLEFREGLAREFCADRALPGDDSPYEGLL